MVGRLAAPADRATSAISGENSSLDTILFTLRYLQIVFLEYQARRMPGANEHGTAEQGNANLWPWPRAEKTPGEPPARGKAKYKLAVDTPLGRCAGITGEGQPIPVARIYLLQSIS
jgi:hypothetical protein